MTKRAGAGETRRIERSCFICGGPVAFDVTEYPRTAWANDKPVSTYTMAYAGRACACPLTGWAEDFAERQAWHWMKRGAIELFHQALRVPDGEVGA